MGKKKNDSREEDAMSDCTAGFYNVSVADAARMPTLQRWQAIAAQFPDKPNREHVLNPMPCITGLAPGDILICSLPVHPAERLRDLQKAIKRLMALAERQQEHYRRVKNEGPWALSDTTLFANEYQTPLESYRATLQEGLDGLTHTLATLENLRAYYVRYARSQTGGANGV